MDSIHPADADYVKILLDPIRVCAQYRPKFGYGAKGGGFTLAEFQTLYSSDPFYHWFGLDNPLMYAAHKAAGGMTSIYRQIGIGCEALFRRVLQDTLNLSDSDVRWSYTVPVPGGKTRTLYLDGCVPLSAVRNAADRQRLQNWMAQTAVTMNVHETIFQSLRGIVFEVRQGYKSKDSKRQNADIANAAAAYAQAYLPCVAVLSTQIDNDILLRYRTAQWAVLTGMVGTDDPLNSTYDFMKTVIGYDLGAFFQRNSDIFHTELDAILRALLAPDMP